MWNAIGLRIKNVSLRVCLCVFFSVSLGFLGLAVFSLIKPIPEPEIFSVDLPEKFEIFPKDKISPGTFKIDVLFNEILSQSRISGRSTIVSYGFDNSSNSDPYVQARDQVKLEFWLPKRMVFSIILVIY